MKIALCIFGLIREFPNAVKSWTFLEDHEHDVYFSTYSYSYEKKKNLGINIVEKFTKEQLRSFLPKASNIEFYFEPGNINFNTWHNSNKMLFHWKKSFELLKNSGKKYDAIILLRPDLFFTAENFREKLPTLDFSNNEIIYSQNPIKQYPPPTYLSLMDTFFVGNFEVMKKLIDGIDYIDNHTHFAEYHIAKFLINNNIYAASLSMTGYVIRSTTRDTFKNYTGNIFDIQFLIELYNKNNIFHEAITLPEDLIIPT